FFFGTLLVASLAILEKIISSEKAGVGQVGVRIFLFFIPIEFFGQDTARLLEDWADINLDYVKIATYKELEHWGVLLILTTAFFAASVDRDLLRDGKYVDFVLLLCRGVFSASFTLFCFVWLEFVSIEFSTNVLFLCSLAGYILAGLGPSRLGILQLAVGGTLPVIPQASRTEGLRDNLILGALMILFFKFVLQWLEGPYWVEEAIILAAIGMFVQVVLLRKGLNPLEFLGSQNFLARRMNLLDNSLQQFQNELTGISPQLAQRTVYSTTEDVPLLKKADTTLSIEKDGIIVPLMEDENETTLFVVGKGQIQATTPDSAEPKDEELAETTTLTIPRKDWETIKATEALVPSSFSEKVLVKAGSSKEKISQQIKSNLTQLRDLSKDRKAFSALIPDMSRYGITETKGLTSVSLPGLRVIEQRDLSYVKLPFLEVMDSRSGDLVSLPFLRVLSTKKLDIVHLPFLSVIDTPKGSIVKIFGFTIREGKLDETELRQTIQESLETFVAAKEQLGLGREIDSSLLLTSSAEGSKMKLLGAGQMERSEEEQLLITPETDELPKKEWKRRKREKKRDRKRRKRTEREATEIEAIPAEESALEGQPSPKFEAVSQEGATIDVSVCELCNEPITTVSIACPFCGREFHREHWQAWINKRGTCPICHEKVKVIFP
ncbi:MAG: RING finger protein, partial [Candidatus Thorarchaeota archaeon]